MAARRLLIVMLVLLGLSTLAAALVPQHSLRDEDQRHHDHTTHDHHASRRSPRLPSRPPRSWSGASEFPVVSPVKVGQELVLLVASRAPTQLAIREFGQLGFAAPDAPARFELLPTLAGTFGIQFEPSGKVAAKSGVVAPEPEAPEGREEGEG